MVCYKVVMLFLSGKVFYHFYTYYELIIGKDPDAGRDWGQEEKGTTEDEKVGWHHRLNGRWVGASSGSW